MCGRYTVLTEDEIIEIREILKKLSVSIVRDELTDYVAPVGEVFPADSAPIITAADGGAALESVRWGFKRLESPGVIINARSETAEQKSTFARYLKTGRCVVPAGEFFEWERLGSTKKKYYARDRHGNLLFMAGLYRDVAQEGSPQGVVREFVILTKEACGEMAGIHSRMPVILRVNQIEAWLTGKLSLREAAGFEYDLTVEPCDDGQLHLF